MYRRLLRLELKNFIRNPQFGTNLALRILMFFSIVYFALMFMAMPFLLFFFAKEELQTDPLLLFCRFFLYYWAFDLVLRYFIQQMPTQNIKPFLGQNIPKNKLVDYTILKTFFHFFNWGNLLFLIPFAVLLVIDGFNLAAKFLDDFNVCYVARHTHNIRLMFFYKVFYRFMLDNHVDYVDVHISMGYIPRKIFQFKRLTDHHVLQADCFVTGFWSNQQYIHHTTFFSRNRYIEGINHLVRILTNFDKYKSTGNMLLNSLTLR